MTERLLTAREAERIILLGSNPEGTGLGQEFGATDVVRERGEGAVERVRELTEHGAHRQRFVKERLEPFLAEGPVDPTRAGPPNRQYGYELHYTTE